MSNFRDTRRCGPLLVTHRALQLALAATLLLLANPWSAAMLGAKRSLAPTVEAAAIPRPDHVVIVIMENHSYSAIIGSPQAPYINSLAQQGALFTDSHAVTHPSEPNYLALFSGSTQGLTDDSCPHTYTTANLGSALIAAGLSFGGYSEGLPSVGSTVCTSGAYARKHNPWVNFSNVPSSANMPFTSFPSDFATLPTVAIVVPDLNNDMHDGSILQGDTWLQQHLDGYVQWARANNSLLIVSWDEDDFTSINRIPTIFVGPMVQPGHYGETINHYNVLRTLEDFYGLPYAGNSATASPITDVWVQAPPTLYALTVSPAPADGYLTATGISCGTPGGTGDCTESYASGTSATLTANPAAGYRVAAWTGCTPATPTSAQCTVAMTQARTVSVSFTIIDTITPMKTYTVTPCRVVDTRLTSGGLIPARGSRSFHVTDPMTGQGGESSCGVPFGAARGVYVNVVSVGPDASGYLTVHPYASSVPLASTLNFTTGQTIANAILVPVCNPSLSTCDFDLTVTMGPASAHVVIDVTGYVGPSPQ